MLFVFKGKRRCSKKPDNTPLPLAEKARDEKHPFALADVKNLVNAINQPIAVFSYGDKNKAQNVIAEIERNGKKFVVEFPLIPLWEAEVWK